MHDGMKYLDTPLREYFILNESHREGRTSVRLAVLSDIHGNDVAFEACLRDLKDRHADAYCFLGDYVGELPGIRHTLDMLYALMETETCYVIRGNKEDYQLKGIGQEHPEWDAYPSTVGMLRYGRQQLTPEDLNFLKELPSVKEVKTENLPELLLCHGSPRRVNEDLYAGNEHNQEILNGIPQEYVLCGHTHRAAQFAEYGKCVWNGGSVGMPVDGQTGAQYMLLHGEGGVWKPEFITVGYDVERVVAQMHENNLYELAPFWTRITEAVLRGADASHGMLLWKAMQLCEKRYGTCNWPMIPEDCWESVWQEFCGEKE